MEFRVQQLHIATVVMVIVGFFASASESYSAETVWKVTCGSPDVSLPASFADDNCPRRYGLGCAVQLGPTTAALFCNLRVLGPDRWDFEDGTDVFVFDALDSVGKGGPMPISRNETEKDPETGESRFIVKYPALGGFWPLGAKRPDGSPHPGAGKGFAFCEALSFVGQGDKLVYTPPPKTYREVLQLSFDGRRVSVVGRDLIRSERLWATPDGWKISASGIQMAIPDDDDLLMAVSAKKDGISQTGVCSFRYLDERWQPVAFMPVTSGYEPSLVRRNDRSLVFGVRPTIDSEENSIMLWCSTNGGKTWKQTLHATKVRTESPVSVHATPDGRAFVAANVLGANRSQLAVWPLTEGATKLGPPLVIRDCLKKFGPPPNGVGWFADHPMSAILRLGDGRWHGIVTYRIMVFPGFTKWKTEPIMPQTGCYVEEVTSAQPVTPPWRF